MHLEIVAYHLKELDVLVLDVHVHLEIALHKNLQTHWPYRY